MQHPYQLAACTRTCLVPLGDRSLLPPCTGNHPCGHLLDLNAVCIPVLCYHFPTWATQDPIGLPHCTLKQLAAPFWA